MSEIKNDKDKVNNNQINFKWKEIDDGANKKSRGSLFSFIKRKAAEFTKAVESAKQEKAVQAAKEKKVDKPAKPVDPIKTDKPAKEAEPKKAGKSTKPAEPVKAAQEAEPKEPEEPENATKPEEVKVDDTAEKDQPAESTKQEKAAQEAKPKETDEQARVEKAAATAKPARRRIRVTKWRVLIGVLCLIVAALVGTFIYAYNSVPDIDPDASSIYSNIDLSSIIYDSKGEEIDKLYYTEDREIVAINDIPEKTKNAFIAIEDKTFYKHHGLNYKRLFGAVLSKLTGRTEEISGTSTITQQLARNVFLADIKSERTLSRKIREMIYALKIERAYSKDEILEAYLNTIYLGYGCYGIKAAAYTYFGKEVSDLSLAESAALAALPQAPDTYALLKDTEDEDTTYMKKYGLYANELASERRDLVLDLMAEQGYISTSKAEKAKKKLADVLHPHIEKKPKELTYFTDYLTKQVANDLADKYSLSPDNAEQLIHTGGLRIYSTIDQDIQNAINTEFSDDWNFPYSEEDPQAAMVVAEVGTGRIRAMVGGRNTSGQMLFNRATSPRQPGSSIKPLAVYSAALQKSEEYAKRGQTFPFTDFGIDRQGVNRWGKYITAGSVVVDERLFINGEVWPLNFSRGFSGYRTFRTALQQSINTCAVKIQLQVGADYSMEMLRKYGISTISDDASKPVNDYNPAALALGAMTYGVTPLDMAIAYGTFPNGGVRNSPAAYTKVTNAEGEVILEKKIEETRVLDEGVAFIMRDCLESVVSRGIARNATIYGTQAGGKTGTTNDNYDYWFVGFTPKYSAALWIGTDHNTVMSGSSGTAALLWSRIMEQIPDITEGEYPPQPEDVVSVYGEYYTENTKPY
ncbi:MAG: transglycosylase domain-containing protein [Mogibacterium sp.]|nr:transglycosylase domain-containing protein [Mogibacterium sp.]